MNVRRAGLGPKTKKGVNLTVFFVAVGSQNAFFFF